MNHTIKSIAVYDHALDKFENQYITPEGISYNSYIVFDRHTAVIDTADKRMAEQWRQNLENALGSVTPDYLIVQHLEPDHSSQIDWFMAKFPEAKLVCTSVAKKMLPQLADISAFSDRIIEVADCETLKLGEAELEFVTAPMVHWPEVMMVYDNLAKTLFSADAFGRFGNPDPELPWACEARRYYFNIVGKYGNPVQTVLKKLKGKEIDTIAPLHGPVLTGDIKKYLDLYHTWSTYTVETPGVLIAYASIHGLTAEAAQKMAEILRDAGAPKVAVTDLTRDDMAEAVEDAFRHSHLVVMSSTYDAGIFPPMHDFLHHLMIKGFRNRHVAIVENGMWAPAAGRKMKEMLMQMPDVTIAEPIVTLKGRMTEMNVEQLRTLASHLLANG